MLALLLELLLSITVSTCFKLLFCKISMISETQKIIELSFNNFTFYLHIII